MFENKWEYVIPSHSREIPGKLQPCQPDRLIMGLLNIIQVLVGQLKMGLLRTIVFKFANGSFQLHF